MKTTLELAKELLRKGKVLGDIELIQMANEMLDSVVPNDIIEPEVVVEPPKKRGRPAKAKAQPGGKERSPAASCTSRARDAASDEQRRWRWPAEAPALR